MDIQQVSPDTLTPYPDNPRDISQSAIDAVARSIETYGFRQPIVVDGDGVVIVGHTRLLAAKKLRLQSVPVHRADLSPAEARAYRLADNRTNELAVWDDDTLAAELRGLSEMVNADAAELAELTAFNEDYLSELLYTDIGTAGVDDEELPLDAGEIETRAKRGDVWQLGRHRLMCGDSVDAADVSRLLGGATPRLCVTDPPYGVNYDANWRNQNRLAIGYSRRLGKVENDDKSVWTDALALVQPDVLYQWGAALHSAKTQIAIEHLGFQLRTQIVWVKPSLVISRGHYHWQHELCFYAVRHGKTAQWIGDRKQTSVWEIANLNPFGGNDDEGTYNHSTQKPLECMERPIRNHEGDVYDPFVGSGTTLIAAERQDRACYAMEIAPQYVDMAIVRWEKYTGGEAVLCNS